MPKQLLIRRFYERLKEHRAKIPLGVLAQWRVAGPPGFVDYCPDVPATFPEKLVFAELIRRQVNFYFSWYLGDLPITPTEQEHLRPDFILPDYNIIIEIYGVYWHTRPGAFEHDAYRAMLLMASGYKVHILTDYEVIRNVKEAIDTIPELRTPLIHGSMAAVGHRPIHPAAPLAARARRWPKVGAVRWTKSQGGTKGIRTQWVVEGRPPTKKFPAPEPMLYEIPEKLRTMAGEWALMYSQWLQEYQEWLENYEEWREAYLRFFGVYPP